MACEHEWRRVNIRSSSSINEGHQCIKCAKQGECEANGEYTRYSDGTWNYNCRICSRLLDNSEGYATRKYNERYE